MTKQEVAKWLQGLAVALALALAQWIGAGHPTLWGTLATVVLTRVAGYGVSKVPIP